MSIDPPFAFWVKGTGTCLLAGFVLFVIKCIPAGMLKLGGGGLKVGEGGVPLVLTYLCSMMEEQPNRSAIQAPSGLLNRGILTPDNT